MHVCFGRQSCAGELQDWAGGEVHVAMHFQLPPWRYVRQDGDAKRTSMSLSMQTTSRRSFTKKAGQVGRFALVIDHQALSFSSSGCGQNRLRRGCLERREVCFLRL